MPRMDRREFLGTSARAAGVAAGVATLAVATLPPSEQLQLAVMGVNGRGKALASEFASIPAARVAVLCDVDERVIPGVAKIVEEKQGGSPPRVEKDVRRVLEDKSIDALVIAAPDHWHALAAVWACQAGKDVYVEKPISHNLVEGRRMVEAARRYKRIMQVGTQRRSAPHWASMVEYLRSGKLGHVAMARAWIIQKRVNIGHTGDGPVPEGVDYNLWLGPAPERPFNPNRFHYTWHWFWDYGTGELGNNGVHGLDMARWGLGVDAPTAVTSGGGKLFYDDDQETPDTQIVTYEFPGTSLVWEHRTWSNYGIDGRSFGVTFYGDQGTLASDDKGWQVTVDGKITDKQPGSQMEMAHLNNFIDCVKERRRPNADIEIGHRSTSLCHLGNIAQRLGRKLVWDGARERFPDDDEANRLLAREYRAPFVLPAQA